MARRARVSWECVRDAYDNAFCEIANDKLERIRDAAREMGISLPPQRLVSLKDRDEFDAQFYSVDQCEDQLDDEEEDEEEDHRTSLMHRSAVPTSGRTAW